MQEFDTAFDCRRYEIMKKNQLCDQVIEFVLTCKTSDLSSLTIAGIARKFNVSQSFLDRKFRVERNFPVREYLFREKMYRTAHLLTQENGLTVKEIGLKMGFLDKEYFTYIFKNHYGVSPGKYRECKLGKRRVANSN